MNKLILFFSFVSLLSLVGCGSKSDSGSTGIDLSRITVKTASISSTDKGLIKTSGSSTGGSALVSGAESSASNPYGASNVYKITESNGIKSLTFDVEDKDTLATTNVQLQIIETKKLSDNYLAAKIADERILIFGSAGGVSSCSDLVSITQAACDIALGVWTEGTVTVYDISGYDLDEMQIKGTDLFVLNPTLGKILKIDLTLPSSDEEFVNDVNDPSHTDLITTLGECSDPTHNGLKADCDSVSGTWTELPVSAPNFILGGSGLNFLGGAQYNMKGSNKQPSYMISQDDTKTRNVIMASSSFDHTLLVFKSGAAVNDPWDSYVGGSYNNHAWSVLRGGLLNGAFDGGIILKDGDLYQTQLGLWNGLGGGSHQRDPNYATDQTVKLGFQFNADSTVVWQIKSIVLPTTNPSHLIHTDSGFENVIRFKSNFTLTTTKRYQLFTTGCDQWNIFLNAPYSTQAECEAFKCQVGYTTQVECEAHGWQWLQGNWGIAGFYETDANLSLIWRNLPDLSGTEPAPSNDKDNVIVEGDYVYYKVHYTNSDTIYQIHLVENAPRQVFVDTLNSDSLGHGIGNIISWGVVSGQVFFTTANGSYLVSSYVDDGGANAMLPVLQPIAGTVEGGITLH